MSECPGGLCDKDLAPLPPKVKDEKKERSGVGIFGEKEGVWTLDLKEERRDLFRSNPRFEKQSKIELEI